MSAVEKLAGEMPVCESLSWPSSMSKRFVYAHDVVKHVDGGASGVLVVAATEDRLMEPHNMRRCVAEYGPQARYVEIQHSGHHMMLDLQWEEVLRNIVDFVEEK